ncbi:MAG: outer membrane protein assembly factor BamC [Aquabacterium sp.]|jgi:outer membrane protein assembly factor BamC|nr:MAG: outer membrane protein assembly factor BamC [Aquabacterium sp.]
MQASSRAHTARLLALAAAAALLGGCSSVSNVLSNDKVDYKASQANQGAKLEVPPDLTQLTRDTRYQTTGGTVSATTLQQTQPGALAPAVNARPVAPTTSGDVRIERAGSQRWLVTSLPADVVWTQLRAFWQEQGFALTTDDQSTGVMETNWSENRAKLKTDIIRNAIGSVFDSLYDTGERDRFRTRIERTTTGTEVYISHRGLQEVYTSAQKDQTTWRARAADPDLEAEFLGRLLVKLGAKPEAAKAAVADAPQLPSKARLVAGAPTPTVQVDDGFDAAWRRVGLALDRSGFTVEDRDRAQGNFFVRYVDPTKDRKNDGGFLSRIFGGSDSASVARYRINVKAAADKGTVVTVLDEKGQAENSDTTKRIAGLLVDELK